MKKARLSILITICTVFVTIFASSCSVINGLLDKLKPSTPEPSKVELIFEVPETVEIPYYEYYTVPEITVTDTDGNIYISQVKVTNKNGQTVDFEDGKFFVIYTEDYCIEYTVVFDGENVSKTTTCKVTDKTAPEVTLSATALGAFAGDTVTLPECTYTDNMSAEDEITLAIKVMLGETEVAITDGTITATEAGVYKATYTVTDKAGNKTEKVVDIAVAARENGNIAYFNNEHAQILCGLKTELAASFIARGTGELASPMGGSSTAIMFQNSLSPWGGRLDITAPATTDVSGYNYLYLWVYTTYSSGIKLTYNNVWAGVQTNVVPNVWTRIVFEKGADGNFYTPDSDNFEAVATTRLFETATDAANLNNLMFLASPLNTNGGDVVNVYFGGFCATNELPELPEGTKAWLPTPRITVDNLKAAVIAGSVADPDVEVLYGSEATLKTYVSIDGAERQEVTLPYTYATEGSYEFTFEAILNDTVVATYSKSVGVIEQEEGNIAYFANSEWQAWNNAIVTPTGHVGERGEGAKASPMGGTSTKFYFMTGESYFKVESIALNEPVISNVSGYKYLYLWAYTDSVADVYLIYNNVWAGTKNTIKAGVWQRIVFEKGADGNFYTVGTDNFESSATTRLFDTPSATINPSSLNGFSIGLGTSYAGTDNLEINVYLGGFCACNELPALPQGTMDWLPAPRMTVSNIMGSVEQGATVEPSVNVQFAEGAIVTTYVSVNGADRQEVSEFPYTYETAGTYVFTFEATLDGEVILTQSFEVTVTEPNKNEKTIAKLTSEAAITAYGLKGGWSAESTMAVTPDIAGITYPVNGELPIRFNAVSIGGIMINSPAITDVREWKYIFVDVMIAYGDAEFFIFGYGAPIITVKGGNTWTRVVYVNNGSGNFVLPGATGNYSAADGHDGTHVAFENPANVSAFYTMVLAANNWAYFGQITACNELPELPAGFETNYYVKTIADFTDENAIATYGLTGNFGANIVYDTNAKCVRMDSNPDGVYTGMVIGNPTITDISNFKYIYVDVKVGWGDANFVFNFAWGAPYFTLTGSQGGDVWIRVVAENDGTGKFTLVGASGNMSEGQPLDASIFGMDGAMASANITGVGFHILSGGNSVYFKSFVACNELPTIPQGMLTNYVVS